MTSPILDMLALGHLTEHEAERALRDAGDNDLDIPEMMQNAKE